jgi:hypothetical protein
MLAASGTAQMNKGEMGQAEIVSPEARYGVWKAWGILPDAQVAMEGYYSRLRIEYTTDVVGGYDELPNPTLH